MISKKKLTLTIAEDLNCRLDFDAIIKGKGHDRSSIVDALVSRWIELPEDWRQSPSPAVSRRIGRPSRRRAGSSRDPSAGSRRLSTSPP